MSNKIKNKFVPYYIIIKFNCYFNKLVNKNLKYDQIIYQNIIDLNINDDNNHSISNPNM